MGPGIFRGPFFFPGFCREHHRGPLIAPKQRGCHETRHMLSYSVDEGRCRDHSSEDLKRTAYKRSARPAGRRAPLVCVWGPIRCSLSPSYLACNPMQSPSPPPTDTACPSSPIGKGEGETASGAVPSAKRCPRYLGQGNERSSFPQGTRSVAPDTSPRETGTHRETDCVRFSKEREALPTIPRPGKRAQLVSPRNAKRSHHPTPGKRAHIEKRTASVSPRNAKRCPRYLGQGNEHSSFPQATRKPPMRASCQTPVLCREARTDTAGVMHIARLFWGLRL